MVNKKLQHFQKLAQKHVYKFTNYTKNQKVFTLFLLIFVFVLVCFPLVKIKGLTDNESTKTIWFLGTTYFKSMVIVFSSMLFLLGWNMNMRFKGFIVNFLGFRESEPMLNFAFLWIIASAFMGITDTLGMLNDITERISLAWWGKFMLILLLVGLILSFIEVWKGANKNSQKTKILNIVDEDAPKKVENKRAVQHLFEDEDLEG